jgi:P4 family phage/plasmid primase-like protien
MSNQKKIPASVFAEQFLDENYKDLFGDKTLRYLNKRFYAWASGVYTEIENETIMLGFTNWIKKQNIPIDQFHNTRNAAEEALHHIKTSCLMAPEDPKKVFNYFIDSKDINQYLAFENGIVALNDLLTKPIDKIKIKIESPLFFNVAKIPFEFNHKSECSVWLEIINKILPEAEDRLLLQKWFGYHLIPSLSNSKMMFFDGSGANGKSTVLLVLRLVLGEANVSSIPITAFDADRAFKLAVTDGKFANICEEVGSLNIRVEETLKQFVNGGAFTVEKKFKDPYTMYPTAKLTFATNEMPSFNDRSTGIWRRLLYIKFPISIQPKDQKREYLERSFWLDSKELSGILNWAILGAKSVNKSGFQLSARKTEEVEMIFTHSDLLRPWVQDNFEAGSENDTVKSKDILDALNSAIANGLLPRVSQRDLFKEIRAQFPKSFQPKNARLFPNGTRARVVCGIRERDTVTQPPNN